MTDIQIRNRYKKECDILINRLEILQEQVKSHKNLEKEIETERNTLKQLRKESNDISSQIDERTLKLSSLGVNFTELEWVYNKTLVEIEEKRRWIVKQTQLYKKIERRDLIK